MNRARMFFYAFDGEANNHSSGDSPGGGEDISGDGLMLPLKRFV